MHLPRPIWGIREYRLHQRHVVDTSPVLTVPELDRPMTFRLIATRLKERLGWSKPRPETIVLLILLLATIAMPVTYRTGAEVEHPHTIFQGMIDAITGTHHHHHDHPVGAETDDHAAVETSPFVPVGVPLSILENPRLEPPHVDDLNRGTDSPQLPGVSMPITSLASIQSLGLLVAALLAGVADRPLWSQTVRLLNHAVAVESPPPRLLSHRPIIS